VPTQQNVDVFFNPTDRLDTFTRFPKHEVDESEAWEWPFVSVVLPTWREEKYIGACLQSILNQDYPPQRLEVIVVDGMSPDGTREIVRRFARDYPQVKLIDNPDRIQAPGLNRGILASQGTIIVRMDAHTEYSRTYIRTCVRTLQETRSDNVGGPQRLRSRCFFQRMVACALGSRLGTGGAGYRHTGQDGFVDTVFLGAFRREILKRVGLFDPGAITNEDAELNQRIINSGGKVYLSSAIECYYYPRDSFRSLAVQYYRYGRGRARTLLKHRNIISLRSFAPFLFVFGTLALLAVGVFFQPALWAALAGLGLYGGALLIESARLAFKNEAACVVMLPLIFMTTHVSHAFGVAAGLLRYGVNHDWERTPPPKLVD